MNTANRFQKLLRQTLKGTAISIAAELLLSCLLAALVDNGYIAYDAVNYCVIIITAAAIMVGNLLLRNSTDPILTACAVAIMTILINGIVNIIAFSSSFKNVGYGILAASLGTVTVIAEKWIAKRRQPARPSKNRRLVHISQRGK